MMLVAYCLLLAVSLLPGSVLFESGGFGSAWYLRTGQLVLTGSFRVVFTGFEELALSSNLGQSFQTHSER
ncbi:hypothetical protein [Pigmentiphaga litoralis]|uniref:hypothetical protein n=1 Tax=Pigmentiphaga litoralis TaxID=516702 RepID=UPI001679E283|nr:hypothetical protein [Pigmentiphaga litoralis]